MSLSRSHRPFLGLASLALVVSGCGGGGGGGAQESAAAGGPLAASLSSDGRFAVLELVTDLDRGYRDVFVQDLQTRERRLASATPQGTGGNGDSYVSSISGDGRYVVFQSSAIDLIPGVPDGGWNVFRRDVVAGTTALVSVNLTGTYGNGASSAPRISRDGRFVVFESAANNLVLDDTNGEADVFVRDMEAGVTTRVSVDSLGVQAVGNVTWTPFEPGGWSPYEPFGRPDISSDGRFVVFSSRATNLVAGDGNGELDVFLHDLQTGATTRVSVDVNDAEAFGGSASPTITADGRFVAFVSIADLTQVGAWGYRAAFRRDLLTGETILVSVASNGEFGHGDTDVVTLSDDGRYAAFDSDAEDLGEDPPLFGTFDAFLHDCETGETVEIAPGPGRVEDDPEISPDGRTVLYESWDWTPGSDDYRLYLYDRISGDSTFVERFP
jgi:hypothetical protein